jgi:hypothetical protein
MTSRSASATGFSPEQSPPIDLVHEQAQTNYKTAGLTEDWNLVGMADNSTWLNQTIVIWRWLNGKFQTITKEELITGEAYWGINEISRPVPAVPLPKCRLRP